MHMYFAPLYLRINMDDKRWVIDVEVQLFLFTSSCRAFLVFQLSIKEILHLAIATSTRYCYFIFCLTRQRSLSHSRLGSNSDEYERLPE